LELQQRAVEYNAVIKKFPNLRDGLFEQMPPMEMKERYLNDDSLNQNDELLTEEEQRAQQEKNKEEVAKTLLDLFDTDDTGTAGSSPQPPHISDMPSGANTNASILDLFDQPAPSAAVNKPGAVASNQTSSNVDLLFGLDSSSVAPQSTASKSNQDIMDLFGGGGGSASSKPTAAFNGLTAQPASSNLDDIFNLNSSASSAVQQQRQAPVSTNGSDPNDILSLFGTPSTTSSRKANDDLFGGGSIGNTSLVIVAYEKNDIKITVEPDNTQTNSLERPVLKMRAYNTSVANQLREVLFSSAVPKSMQLQLSSPTTKIIQPMDSMSQTITISNPTHVCVEF
jgi:hypothetical protein